MFDNDGSFEWPDYEIDPLYGWKEVIQYILNHKIIQVHISEWGIGGNEWSIMCIQITKIISYEINDDCIQFEGVLFGGENLMVEVVMNNTRKTKDLSYLYLNGLDGYTNTKQLTFR